jgi:hypothetical protein
MTVGAQVRTPQPLRAQMARTSVLTTASCRCGQVAFNLGGPPIVRVACYCTSCRTAGHAFVREFGPPPVVADDGGTDMVLYRKDRVAQISGGNCFKEHRLTPGSPTRRMVATCCGTPMVMDFTKGHWLSFYRARLSGDIPALDMRVMTQDKPAAVKLPDDVPLYTTRSARFMWKLLAAWAAMGFRRPQVPWE